MGPTYTARVCCYCNDRLVLFVLCFCRTATEWNMCVFCTHPYSCPSILAQKAQKFALFLTFLSRESEKKPTKCKFLRKIDKFYAFFFCTIS